MTTRREPNYSAKPHYLGHRKRLRERFMKYGIESLQDYEVVELLLTFSIPYLTTLTLLTNGFGFIARRQLLLPWQAQ